MRDGYGPDTHIRDSILHCFRYHGWTRRIVTASKSCRGRFPSVPFARTLSPVDRLCRSESSIHSVCFILKPVDKSLNASIFDDLLHFRKFSHQRAPSFLSSLFDSRDIDIRDWFTGANLRSQPSRSIPFCQPTAVRSAQNRRNRTLMNPISWLFSLKH